ncbi:MAG: ParA family protein [Planctomycetota bacterium]|nr:ParA family protein [Planctomycetota bacterium]
MHVFAFVNQKGGCGKTTTAVNLAGALAVRGSRVLLVDLDPQAHATMALGHAVLDEPTVRDVLIHEVPLEAGIVEAEGGVALLPADARLVEFEDVAARTLHPESKLARALSECTRPFDVVIVDCPPRTEGVLAANALRAADTAVLVIEAGAFALQGALKARGVLEERALSCTEPFALRAVGTMFDRRSKIARELLVGMHARFGEIMFDSVIRHSSRLREAAAVGRPIHALDPRCNAALDFAALADEVESHVRERRHAATEIFDSVG